VSDGEGRYRLCFRAGSGHIEVAATGYGTAFQHIAPRGDQTVDFPLSPEVVIAGRVVDGTGSPVPGVAVVAAVNGHDPGALVDTDDEGGFRLEGLVPGTYHIVARDDMRRVDREVALPAAGQTEEIELVLAEGRTLAGRVLAADGRPVSFARLGLRGGTGPFSLGSAVTHEDGRFAIAALPRVKVTVHVEHQAVDRGAEVDLTLADARDVEIVCARSYRVSGIVKRDGKPLAAADVYTAGAMAVSARTRDDGTFELRGVVPGRHELWASIARRPARTPPTSVEVRDADVRGVELLVDSGATIAGVVVDPQGAPVPGVTVRFSGGDTHADATTRDDGSFEVAELRPGAAYHVTLTRAGRPASLLPAPGTTLPEVTVPPGQERVDGLRLVAVVPDRTISGRVVRDGPEPVGGLTVVASRDGAPGAQALVAGDGRFTLEDLLPGRYAVYLMHLGPGEDALRVEAGARDVVIRLPATGRIDGTLVGFASPPRLVIALPPDPGERRRSFAAREVSLSSFTISGLAPGTYDVIADSASARVVVPAGGAVRVTVDAATRTRVTGTVVDARTGAAVAGVRCGVRASGVSPATSAADGSFTFEAPPGRRQVYCAASDPTAAQLREVIVDLEPGATATVAVSMVVLGRAFPLGSFLHLETHARGVRVRATAPRPGLREGDVILRVDEIPLAGVTGHGALLLLLDRPPGTAARLLVERDGRELTVEIVPEPRS
jgi:hypothetical protein